MSPEQIVSALQIVKIGFNCINTVLIVTIGILVVLIKYGLSEIARVNK